MERPLTKEHKPKVQLEGPLTKADIPKVHHLEEPYGRMPNKRTYTNSIKDGIMLMEGHLTEGHIPKVHLPEECYDGRTTNRRNHTNNIWER